MHTSVHERLKSAIFDASFTIKKFSELTSVPYRTLQGYLSGNRDPGANNLQLMAPHLGVSLHWLLTGEGDRHAGASGVAEEQSKFFIAVRDEIAEHNRGVIEKMMGQLGRIISEGDYRKTSAIQGLLAALDPEDEEGDK